MTFGGWGYGKTDADTPDQLDHEQFSPFEYRMLEQLERIGDALTKPRGPLTRLLDAEPDDLADAIKAGARELARFHPLLTPSDSQRLAEVVIDAALKHAADEPPQADDAAPTNP